MNLDRLISFFRKAPAKQAAAAVGGFEAAAWTRDRSTVWTPSAEEAANPAPFTREEILRLSRYLANNFPLAERILSVAEIYGVNSGLVPNPATTDTAFNGKLGPLIERWATSSFCSSNNQYNFYEMQKLIVRELVLANEVFIILIKSPSGYPQLQLVAAENVRHSGKKEDSSIGGLYVDAFGKVTAYNIFTGKVFQKVDASNVIHLQRHKQIGQLRPVGSFAASLNSMRDHKDCMLLEKKAVKVHATLAAVVQRKGAEAPPGGIGGDLIPLPNSSGKANVGLERAFPGAVVYAEPGEDIELKSSDRSTDGFMAFLELLVRDVCLNISLPFEFLVNPEKLNGTAIRFVLSDAAFFFENLQNILIDGALNRIYSWVAASFINDGKLAAPKDTLPWAVGWTRPISITVDQQRISNTEIALLQNSLLNYETFYSARGKDWRQELRQHALEEQFLNELSEETGVGMERLRSLQAGSATIEVAA